MKKFPIALQLYSVREDMERDFEGTLRRVKELGYDGVEFAGLFGKEAAEIKRLLKSYDLIPVSAHVPFETMMENPEKVFDDYVNIGCRYVVIPYLTEEYRPGGDGFQKVVDGAYILGEIAKKKNIQLLYHNHDFEFVKIDGKYALDILYDTIPSDLLKVELDTCWVKVAGEDPSAYLRKYSNRVPVVHLKDFVMEEGLPKEEAFEYRPLGKGVQDFMSILKASDDIGAEWVVVEQDMPSKGTTPMECAEISIQYMKSIQ